MSILAKLGTMAAGMAGVISIIGAAASSIIILLVTKKWNTQNK